jgi:hypothetical protein
MKTETSIHVPAEWVKTRGIFIENETHLYLLSVWIEASRILNRPASELGIYSRKFDLARPYKVALFLTHHTYAHVYIYTHIHTYIHTLPSLPTSAPKMETVCKSEIMITTYEPIRRCNPEEHCHLHRVARCSTSHLTEVSNSEEETRTVCVWEHRVSLSIWPQDCRVAIQWSFYTSWSFVIYIACWRIT